ncbi:MAG TPA: BON domain-containing protein [Polyangia bacterium]|nr:BON domain-containing protein [Polyangia bacterium]
MKRARRWGVVAAWGLALGLAAPVAAQQPSGPTQAGDQVAMIQARLHGEPSLRDDHIDVTIDNGVAVLKGTVDSAAEKATAARLASVHGVVGVDDRLVVAGGGRAPAPARQR